MKETIFDLSRPGVSGAGLQDPEFGALDPSHWFDAEPLRTEPIGLPEVSEIELVRHYTALGRRAYGVDDGSYPLGSCTMKYNPKRHEPLASLSGFAHAHPRQPESTLPGLWELLFHLAEHLAEISGMDHFTLQPAAGAHGELTGLLMTRAWFESRGIERDVVLVQDSAHGTNPASASMAGYRCEMIRTTPEGLTDLDALEAALDDSVAAVMLTNPSTFGLFEENIQEIAERVHDNGSLLIGDGANMNSLMGIVRPGDMGFDVLQLNTHKTFSTPHLSGGAGAGPCGVKAFLEPFLPIPVIRRGARGYSPEVDRPRSIGRMKSFYGHVGVLIRAYCYILTSGPQGLRTASENAVLNANYVQARLSPYLPPVFGGRCMHECLLSTAALEVSAMDFAKRLIDHGVHPPTLVGAGCVYFPGHLRDAMLIEPTETETRESLDRMIEAFLRVAREALHDPELVRTAPHTREVGKILPSGSRGRQRTHEQERRPPERRGADLP
ncbi:aminomethyl-transferring glycine dehydrogenase subunit GcvPB [Sorangium sp. So ce381]|uniref:aminomethyl-transferring glycine dehydrogenase subunit GcvPB n=1 Tax=Sorangium sp. So ce381 TaxID=3133307 RepID=UPI003F5BEA15